MARQSTKPTLEAIQIELADADYKVRKEAIRKLMRYQRALAVEPLLALLGDGRSDVRAKAVEALGRLKDTRAVVPMLGLLKDKSASVRAKVAGTLGSFGERSVVRPLNALLNDPNTRIRQGAARSLGQLRDPSSLPLLLNYLKDAEDEEFYYLARAIGDFDNPGLIEPLLAECGRAGWAQGAVANALSRLSESSIPALTKILLDQTRPPEERSCVVSALGIQPRQGTEQALIQALEDGDANVRHLAAWALGQLKDPIAIDPLLRLLADHNGRACQTAINTLTQFQAAFSQEQTEQAIDSLIACLSSREENVVCAAANLLKNLHATRAVPALLETLFRLRNAFLWPISSALIELGDTTLVDEILPRLSEITRGNLTSVLYILQYFPNKNAVEPLLAMLNSQIADGIDTNIQMQVVRLLGQLGDTRALEPLRAMHRQTGPGPLHNVLTSNLRLLEAAHRQLA